MNQRKIYDRPPAVLVALEVRHPAADPLTHRQRLDVKAALAHHTPIMRTPQLAQMTSVGSGGAPAPLEMRVEEFPRYFSRDSTMAVSLKADAVVIETTRYLHWERLRALIVDVLRARQEVGGIDGVERVGLRYVNEVRVPVDSSADWTAWISAELLGPALIGEQVELSATQWQGIAAYSADSERMVVLRYGPRNGYAVDPAGDLKRPTPLPGPFFLLDLDSSWTPDQSIPEFNSPTLQEICDSLHTPVHALFEQTITDRLRREVFGLVE